MRKSKKSLFLPHFCFPWGRPWGNHAKCCTDGKRIWCLQIVSQHVPIYLPQFSSYSNRKCKIIAIFTYRSPHFCFPWRRPCDYHAICCMDGKKIQCLPNACSMYLSIFNSFRVIRCLSQCVSPKIAIFTTFLFSLGTLNVVWMEREFDAYKLSCCMCPSNYNRFWDTARYLWKSRHFIIPSCIRRRR